MASVTFNSSVGGDGSTVTDDANASTGLANGGHRTRFVPALAQLVAVASFVVTKANQFFSANGITGTSSTSLTIGTGSKSLTIETGKSFVAGQPIRISAQSDPENKWMQGTVTSYDSGTGALVVNVTSTAGAGTLASWTAFVISPLDALASAFIRTLLDDADASAAQTTLGISAYVKTLLGAADAAAAQTILGISAYIKTLLGAADATAARATLGALSSANDAVLFANLQNLANQRVIGRNTAATGDPEEVTLSQLLDWIGSAAHGDILFRGASAWTRLAASDTNQVLRTKGAGVDPQWGSPASIGAPVALTSGVSFDFAGIPSWARLIVFPLAGASTSGTSDIIVQLGDAGGFETTGYSGDVQDGNTRAAWSSGITLLASTAAAGTFGGALILALLDASTFTWAIVGAFGRGDIATGSHTAGSKSTSAALTQLRLTTVGGSDTFDAGKANILYW